MKGIISKPWFYNVVPLMIWVLLFVFPFISSPASLTLPQDQHFLLMIFTTNLLLLVIFYLHTYALHPLLKLKNYWAYSAGMAGVVTVYICCFYYFKFLQPVHFHPFPPNAAADKQFQPQMRDHGSFIPVMSLLITLLCSFCYRIILDQADKERILKEKETTYLRTELNFLRSQINPHFLFNVLNNITALARKRSAMVEPAIMSLSQLMRYMLYETADNKVPVSKEVQYLSSYIDLQLLRFDNEVSVRKTFKGDYEGCFIHPMLLIPLVENAFKYGTANPEMNLINISLTIAEDGESLLFEVFNFYDPEQLRSHTSTGIGLKNIKRRLDIVYPHAHSFHTWRTDSTFTAELSIRINERKKLPEISETIV